MADVKISLLTDATTVGGTDEFPIVQGGVTKRATITELKTGLALTKGDVGLGNVDNTSDANKPVSTAQQTALDGKSATSHTHVLTAGATDVTITAANLNALDDGITTTLHFHDSDRARANHTGTQAASTISDFSTAADARIAAAGLVIGTDVQAFDADLSTIAGLTATTDNFLQAKSSAWASRTPAQVMADLTVVPPIVIEEATTARTLAASDNGKIINCTSASATTITVGTAFNGCSCTIMRSGTGLVTIAASSTTLNGNLVLNSQFLAAGIVPTEDANTFNIVGGTGTVNGAEQTVASATTTDIGATATFQVSITGTTTITGLGTAPAGTQRWGRFTGALTFTHNATSLILPNNGSNITTAANDRFMATSLGSGNWLVNWYQKADGTALVGGSGTSISGTPANNQLAIWTSASAIEGDSGLTYDGTSLNLATAKNFQIAGATVLADAAGTTTLSNIDAIDATTEATIEAAIDTLANLTSIQGQTFTLTGAFIRSGAHSFTQTTTGATNVTYPTTGTLATLAETEALTNKTYNGNTLTAGTYTLTGSAGKTLTFNNSITLAGTDGTTMTFPGASASIGYLGLPQNSQSAAYTTVLADAGKHILHPSADTTARTFTIDSNANVAYPVGTTITFVNQNAAGVVTIAITTDTMRLAGAGTTGSRTLAANGVATAIKITTTEWIINGTGLT